MKVKTHDILAALNLMTPIQRRRSLMWFGLVRIGVPPHGRLARLAEIEGVTRQRIQKSLTSGLCRAKKMRDKYIVLGV